MRKQKNHKEICKRQYQKEVEKIEQVKRTKWYCNCCTAYKPLRQMYTGGFCKECVKEFDKVFYYKNGILKRELVI